MNVLGSIFLDFNLPNATTWFYFSFLLAVALFFKFSRLLSMRNWDVVSIFLLVPGLLLLQQSKQPPAKEENVRPLDVGQFLLNGAGQAAASPLSGPAAITGAVPVARFSSQGKRPPMWVAYLWLLLGSGYLLLRCLFDLVLVRRPALAPNLNFGGLAWLACALFICLTAVAFRPTSSGSVAASSQPGVLVGNKNGETIGQPTVPFQLGRELVGESSLLGRELLERTLAVLCHLAVVIGLILIGKHHFRDLTSGMAAATFYLLAPYTGYFIWQVHHVWPVALMIWAIVFYRKPMVAGIFMGVAAGTAFFPALVLPIWVSFYWRRGAGRFLALVLLTAGFCLAITAFVLWLRNDLERIIDFTLALPDWQPWKFKSPTQESVWSGVHWAYRLPVSILYLALVITTAFWPTPKNLAHVLALSAVVLIGIQFWYANQGGVYILWYLPLLLLLVFRPNLSHFRPPKIQPETDWLTLRLRKLRGELFHFFRPSEPLVPIR